jgi:hypothetical protein
VNDIPRVPVPFILLMKVCTRQRRAVQIRDGGGEVLRWRWWSIPSLQHVPSRSVRIWSEELQWRRTSWSEPVVPTPSYSAARQGPTSLLTGWASPIRTRVKGPMGRWAHWWRDQSNINMMDWWNRTTKSQAKGKRPRLISLLIYTVWNLWKERNCRIFEGRSSSPTQVRRLIKDEYQIRRVACGEITPTPGVF